jgi:hypothetical protein
MQIWGSETYPNRETFCFGYLQIWGAENHPHYTCRTGEQKIILIGSAFSLGHLQIWGADTYPHKENPFCFDNLQIWGSRKHHYRELFFILADVRSRNLSS